MSHRPATVVQLNELLNEGHISHAEYWPLFAQIATPSLPSPPTSDLLGPPVAAYHNHGRWVVDCECGSAQVTYPADRRVFCPFCVNGGNSVWRPVVWPNDWQAIEASLAQAPVPERNWRPNP